MASLSKEAGRNSWKLSWYDADNRRKAIRLGDMPKKTATQFQVRFEELLGVRRGGGTLPLALQAWIDSLEEDLRDRLVKVGLVAPRLRATLGKFCKDFKASRENVAKATRIRDAQVCELLIERFGAEVTLDTITVRDAEEWRQWLATKGNKRDKERDELSDNTVRRRTGVARQIFATAIRWGYIKENPFAGLATTVRENLNRRVFVSWADVAKIIEKAPGLQWKALIAFVRLVGCRVPSELQGLTWADLNFAERNIVIRSPKTAHHGGEHALRSVPMFPELVPYLAAWSDIVDPGVSVPLSTPVFPIAKDPKVNLRTQFSRLIVNAKLTPWEKLFVNLRSSRETELLAVYPAADVCRWMGHSPAVAARFYAQARPEVAERATRESTVAIQLAAEPAETAGTIAGTVGGENGDHQCPSGTINENQESAESLENQPVLMADDGSITLVMDSENGRGGTRTPDIYFVRVAL